MTQLSATARPFEPSGPPVHFPRLQGASVLRSEADKEYPYRWIHLRVSPMQPHSAQNRSNKKRGSAESRIPPLPPPRPASCPTQSLTQGSFNSSFGPITEADMGRPDRPGARLGIRGPHLPIRGRGRRRYLRPAACPRRPHQGGSGCPVPPSSGKSDHRAPGGPLRCIGRDARRVRATGAQGKIIRSLVDSV